MTGRSRRLYSQLLCGAAMATVLGAAAAAQAEEATFTIPPQSLSSALASFSEQTGRPVLYRPEIATAKSSPGASGSLETEVALNQLLAGTGLTFQQDGNTFLIVRASDPQSGSAAGDGAEGTVQALIVTAQKREENIQDVPIAMSAFTQEDLTRSQVAGGPDLMTQVPNFTFTKTNFSSYSIQIRGIGTQAISATTDAAVAVAFNNTPFIRNRFFEQEFYDLQRVEVLRGPQGTLYGRNATAGVVNIISQKPKFTYESRLSLDVSNYKSHRLEGMLNIPLVEDKVALRIAGAWTKRDGYDTNQITGNQIDGRDLWSTRTSLRFTPNDKIEANLIWEHFQENDDRLRSGKQLCHTDEVTSVAGFPTTHYQTTPEYGQQVLFAGVQGSFSQGCAPSSLYSPDSFQTPNGLSLPYYGALAMVSLPIVGGGLGFLDPYVSRTQSRDLRVIESTVDPDYRAKSDVVELQVGLDLNDSLRLSSETAWSSDFIFSLEDYNRFNTTSGVWLQPENYFFGREGVLSHGPNGGVFCDPQIGCADRLVGVDLSTARSRQFSQEFRLSSDYGGRFNFSLGANFLRYDTVDKYYVFFNSLSLYSATQGNRGIPYQAGVTDNSDCLQTGMAPSDPFATYSVTGCMYIDPNSIGSLNDMGHNYFLSKNPYKLISYAVFGEAYYNITDNLKLTTGLRWTVDRKEAPRIPSWVLAANSIDYPTMEVTKLEWREPTGRVTLDWKPDLGFTDETLLYASYAHGYKAGGANPPPTGLVCYGGCGSNAAAFLANSATHPKTFEPEFVNAFELGSKNTLLDGRLTVNGDVFYYDYTGYQISQIVDRSAVNMNFDAKVWGAELEADWRPLENLRLGLKLGYESTKVGDGAKAIDLMDRTAGNPDWVVVRPFPTFPSNCILPAWLLVGNTDFSGHTNPELVNVGGRGGGNMGGCEEVYVLNQDPATGATYTPFPYVNNPGPGYIAGQWFRMNVNYAGWNTDMSHYPGWPTGTPLGTDYPGFDPSTILAMSNNGEGFYKDLSGNELPNAPHITATVTADYTVPLPSDWLMTMHTDLYYQSEAWTRIFNMPGYDKLKAYTNVNVAAIFSNEDAGWKVMAYIKNVFDKDNITGAFLNSDDTGLTTNVFLNEPRLYGLRVTKEWTGSGWWTGANPNHTGPYPLTVEVGGQVQKQDAPYSGLAASFAGAFPAALDPTATQHRKLDWGDGRDVKVSWRPTGSPWSVSAALRYGKTNNDTARLHQSQLGPERVCAFTYTALCDPTFYGGRYYQPTFWLQATDWSDGSARQREEHTFVDFAVGRDTGLGLFGEGRSTVSAELQWARFRSDTAATMTGIPDWNLPEVGAAKYPSTHHLYQATLSAEREFNGAGPALSWDAGKSILGNQDTGHVNLDWTIGGGVLFGKQSVSITGTERISYYNEKYAISPRTPATTPITTPANISRSKSTSVPFLDLGLGLSYEIQRIKVGAGYRWERYFNVLDAGYAERREYDRTLDGPYFKIAVGFGG